MGKELSEMTLEELWVLFPIILSNHNEAYTNWYDTEKEQLLSILDSNQITRINHIGSTAIKGLIAKPTVDLLLELTPDALIDELITTLQHNEWILMSSQEQPSMQLVFNKGYTKDGFAEKVYHLHVRYAGNYDELYFRDYLMEHQEVATTYANLKLSLLETYKNNRDGYTQAKSDFILTYTKLAKEKYANRYY
ncbi:MAG: GrpB family protein [Turicibacter sp.]